jgi:hypothetical protein
MAARLPRALYLLQYVVNASCVPTRIALPAPLRSARQKLRFLVVLFRYVHV